LADSDLKTLVPSFVIHVNGSRLAVEKEAEIKEIVVFEKIDSPSSFAIKFSDMKREFTDSEDFSVGSKIKITMGYKDEIEELMIGEVTSLTPMYRKHADDILVVKGHNHLHRLARAKKTRSFSEKTDSEIVKQIADDAGLQSEIDDVGASHLFTAQRNQTDYDYIMNMAKKFNCKVWAKEEKLFFKKLEENSGEDVVVEWGKTLVEFYPVLDSTQLITAVEVRGWDKDKIEVITGQATLDDIELKIGGDKIGSNDVKDNFKEEKMIYIDENIVDKDGADKIALDMITDNSLKYITATGRCEGNNKIRSGMIIQVNEVGSRFTGKYYVNSVKHVLSPELGYSTFFELSRNAVG